MVRGTYIVDVNERSKDICLKFKHPCGNHMIFHYHHHHRRRRRRFRRRHNHHHHHYY